jgi:hypothetical protein
MSLGQPKRRNAQVIDLPPGWEIRNLEDALAGCNSKPPWVIKDLLLKDTATQVSAHPHSLKSLAWLSAAIEAAANQTVWGHFDAPEVASTLFIESEDSQWMVEERIRGLAAGLGLTKFLDAPGFQYVRTGPFELVEFEPRLLEIFEYYKPNFVVLSTLQSLLGSRSWKEQHDMQPVNAAIVRMATHYPLVVITHSPWDRKLRRAAGSITQAANFVTTMHFEKQLDPKAHATFAHVRVDSKIGAEELDFSLKLETEGTGEQQQVRRIVYHGSGWAKGVAKAAVQAALEEDPDAPASEIATRCSVTPRYVQQCKKKMQEKK